MEILLLIPLLMIFIEDLKYRAIHWLWILFFFVGVLVFTEVPYAIGFLNVVIIFIQLILLKAYLTIRYKKNINLTKDYLGIGDILLFIPIAFLFSTKTLLLFLASSFLLSIVLHYLSQYAIKSKHHTIPLAGYLAFFLSTYLIFH